jgi:hypothetical protein
MAYEETKTTSLVGVVKGVVDVVCGKVLEVSLLVRGHV